LHIMLAILYHRAHGGHAVVEYEDDSHARLTLHAASSLKPPSRKGRNGLRPDIQSADQYSSFLRALGVLCGYTIFVRGFSVFRGEQIPLFSVDFVIFVANPTALFRGFMCLGGSPLFRTITPRLPAISGCCTSTRNSVDGTGKI